MCVCVCVCLVALQNQRRGHSDENSNAKIKQNRVLVCAPSNAAVDELMKKIILEFKEKCKDKRNPLGKILTWASDGFGFWFSVFSMGSLE